MPDAVAQTRDLSPSRSRGARPGSCRSLMIVLGVAIIARTVAAGGSPIAIGLLLGVLFVAAGAGRLYVARRGTLMADRGDDGRGEQIGRRTLGSPVLFAIVYASLAAGVYFSLGVVADYALGLTPLIFLSARCSSAWPP